MRVASFLVWLSGCVLVTGCGGGADSASEGVPGLDACALFTAADASEVLGAPAAESEYYTRLNTADEQMGTALSNCLYAREGSYETLSIVVNYQRGERPASFDALRAASESAGGEMAKITLSLLDSSEPISGIGDFAYWNAEAGTLTVFAKRHYEIAITADGATAGDKASARARATDIAKRILGRL